MLLNGENLSLESMREIVEQNAEVQLDPAVKNKLIASRKIVERILQSDKKVYSINTGFGALSGIQISSEKLVELQQNIIRSHCASVGRVHSETECRAILLLRTNVLAKGYSGVQLSLVELLMGMLNRKVHPVIPVKGSVGASGDLSPLAHLAAVVIGEGEAYFEGTRMSGQKALEQAGLRPHKIAAKEGLALINGTQQMTAMGALLLFRAEQLTCLADLVAACTLEGVLGSPGPFTSWIHEARPHPGQIKSAKRLRNFMQRSQIAESHSGCDKVQDPYSLRCAPQVHGAVEDLLSHVRNVLAIEINAATDNPLIDTESEQILSQGNFHGQPIAFALDILAMGLSELSSISERRLVKLLDPQWSGLSSFLTGDEEGLNSGFMAAGYTAASLVAENRLLTHPASTDTIPTCNEKEDHVSMGPNAIRKSETILDNLEVVLAIELLAACQALDFRKPMVPGIGPKFAHSLVRQHVPKLDKDRYIHRDIDVVTELIRSGTLFEGAKKVGILD